MSTKKATHTFEVHGWLKDASEDNYEHGQMFDGSVDFTTAGFERFKADAIDELVGVLMEFCGLGRTDSHVDHITVWPDDPSRLDIIVEENEDGSPMSDSELEAWRLGNARMWYCTYTFYVNRVWRSPVALPRLFPKANRA